MTGVPFMLVHSNGKKFLNRDFMTRAKAEHTILNEVTSPNSRSNLMLGDHLYAIPTDKFAEGLPWQALEDRAIHVFRITPSEVICEKHGGSVPPPAVRTRPRACEARHTYPVRRVYNGGLFLYDMANK